MRVYNIYAPTTVYLSQQWKISGKMWLTEGAEFTREKLMV